MNKISAFFLWCSGSDRLIMETCSSETGKYVGIGATVFFTGLFAALAAAYSLFMVFDNLFFSLLFGLLWGLMIFNLDRFIVSSMRKQGRFFGELKMAIPRLVLAVLISLVIAKPLELKIFEKEINGELALMEQENLAGQESIVRNRFEDTRNQTQLRIARLKKEIEIKTLKRDKLREIASQEADGTGGSMEKNAGPIYQIKKADADKVDAELKLLTERNAGLILEEENKLSENNRATAESIAALKKQSISGPAARMEALSRLTQGSYAIWLANWFILLLFIALETAPVFVKLLSPMGPYDHQLKIEEYGYEINRAEKIGILTAQSKERVLNLPNLEREFVEHRLNRSMNRS